MLLFVLYFHIFRSTRCLSSRESGRRYIVDEQDTKGLLCELLQISLSFPCSHLIRFVVFQFPTTPYEHESLVHQGREAKLGRLDECTKKAAGLLVGVSNFIKIYHFLSFFQSFNRKIEVNSTLDKERKKALKEIMNQPSTVSQIVF